MVDIKCVLSVYKSLINNYQWFGRLKMVSTTLTEMEINGDCRHNPAS
jgi:hypothetical protein